MKVRWLLVLLGLVLAGSSCSRDPNVAKRKYLESGNRYFDKDKFKEASIMYRSALKKDPRYGEAYYRLGLTALKLREIAPAERALRRAKELLPAGPDRSDAISKLADIYLMVFISDPRRNKTLEVELNDFIKSLPENSFDRLRLEAYIEWRKPDLDAALAKFKLADEVRPSDPSLVLAYTQALYSKGRFEDGDKLAKQLIEKQKDFAAIYDVLYTSYLRRNMAAEAEQLRKLKADNNPNMIEYRLQLAAHYYALGRRDEADRITSQLAADKKFPNGREKAGDFYMLFRDFDKAIEYYKGGLNGSKEERLGSQRKIADALTSQGKRDQALALVEKELLKEHPKDPIGLALRATLWIETGNREQLQQAINELESSVNRLPQNAVVRYNLGRAYWSKGDAEQAATQFRAAMDIQPDYLAPRQALTQIHLNKKEYALALQMAEGTIAIAPASVEARLLRARALLAIGKHDDARRDLQAILRAYPNSEETTFRLGSLEIEEKNYPAAQRIFGDCLNRSEGSIFCIVGLAEVYTRQEQYGKALELLEQHQKKNPNRPEITLALANTNVQAKRYDVAARLYTALLAREPESSDLHLRLAETFRRMGNLNGAIEHFRRVKQLQPTDPDAAIWLALLLHMTGREAEAKRYYQDILRLQPDNPVALNNLAYIIAEGGEDLDLALTYAQRAKQRAPDSADISDTLGWIYLKKKLTPQALAIYDELTVKYPGNSTYHYHRGMALLQKGDRAQAKTALNAALRGNPKEDEMQKIKELLEKIG